MLPQRPATGQDRAPNVRDDLLLSRREGGRSEPGRHGLGDAQALQVSDVVRQQCKALQALDLSYNRNIALSLDYWAKCVGDKDLKQLKSLRKLTCAAA